MGGAVQALANLLSVEQFLCVLQRSFFLDVSQMASCNAVSFGILLAFRFVAFFV